MAKPAPVTNTKKPTAEAERMADSLLDELKHQPIPAQPAPPPPAPKVNENKPQEKAVDLESLSDQALQTMLRQVVGSTLAQASLLERVSSAFYLFCALEEGQGAGLPPPYGVAVQHMYEEWVRNQDALSKVAREYMDAIHNLKSITEQAEKVAEALATKINSEDKMLDDLEETAAQLSAR